MHTANKLQSPNEPKQQRLERAATWHYTRDYRESREATINKQRARHSTTIYVFAIESEKSRESSLNSRACRSSRWWIN